MGKHRSGAKRRADEESDEDLVDCPECDGTGSVDGQTCEKCDGTGKVDPDDVEPDESEKGAKARENARCKAILTSRVGQQYPKLAQHMAFETDFKPQFAIRLMETAEPRATTRGRQPIRQADTKSGALTADQEAAAIIAASRKSHGEPYDQSALDRAERAAANQPPDAASEAGAKATADFITKANKVRRGEA